MGKKLPKLPKKKTVWNVDVTEGGVAQILDAVIRQLERNRCKQLGYGLYLACANPHSQVEANRNPEFREALQTMDIILPDGVGTVIAAQILGHSDVTRFTGPDFFAALSELLNSMNCGVSYYFFGSTERVLDGIKEKMAKTYPNINVIGCSAPPFASPDMLVCEDMIRDINAKKPDVLWVGMTAPKQELWMYYSRRLLDVPVIAAIGAEFDYFSGTKKRPPKIIRQLGLQWLHRMMQEPGRTWRRNFISTPIFLWNIMRCRCIGC